MPSSNVPCQVLLLVAGQASRSLLHSLFCSFSAEMRHLAMWAWPRSCRWLILRSLFFEAIPPFVPCSMQGDIVRIIDGFGPEGVRFLIEQIQYEGPASYSVVFSSLNNASFSWPLCMLTGPIIPPDTHFHQPRPFAERLLLTQLTRCFSSIVLIN